MIELITRSDIKRYERMLRAVSRRGVDFAHKDTLNDMVFAARRESVAWIEENYTLRNTFTKRSVQIVKASTQRQQARYGAALLPKKGSSWPASNYYMAWQARGKRLTGTGKHGHARIALGARVGKSKRRVARKKYRMTELNNADFETLETERIKGSRRRKLAGAAAMAVRKGADFGFWKTSWGGVIYELTPRGGRQPPKMKTIYRVFDKGTKVKKRDWMETGRDKAYKIAPSMYVKNLTDQMVRRYEMLAK